MNNLKINIDDKTTSNKDKNNDKTKSNNDKIKSNNDKKDNFDIYLEERDKFKNLSKKEKEECRKNVYNGWNKDRQYTVKKWIDNLEFIQLIVYFHMFDLKKVENSWAWILIVLSALSSTISLIQFNKQNEDLVLVVNVTITIFTLFTTLIATWMKKQNYVQRIGSLEKYLQSLNIIISDLQGQIKIHPEDRIPWNEFLDRYRDKVTEFDSSMPLISPEEWKETVYVLTKYYPELTSDVHPWRDNEEWTNQILSTYHKVKYRSMYKRLCSLYYCCNKYNESTNKNSDNEEFKTGPLKHFGHTFHNKISNSNIRQKLKSKSTTI